MCCSSNCPSSVLISTNPCLSMGCLCVLNLTGPVLSSSLITFVYRHDVGSLNFFRDTNILSIHLPSGVLFLYLGFVYDLLASLREREAALYFGDVSIQDFSILYLNCQVMELTGCWMIFSLYPSIIMIYLNIKWTTFFLDCDIFFSFFFLFFCLFLTLFSFFLSFFLSFFFILWHFPVLVALKVFSGANFEKMKLLTAKQNALSQLIVILNNIYYQRCLCHLIAWLAQA